jgi:ABC-type Fe3+-hydroxamate transport system substrate-binding protein
MNFRLLSSLIVLLFACSLCAACTSSGETSGPSPTETPAVTATPVPTTAVSLTPGPTQTAPPGKEVEFQITGGFPSRVTHDLYVEFRGGKGQTFVTTIDVRVTKANGEVVTESLEPVIGNALTVNNAQGDNRVEITVAFVTGGSYKVKDEIVKVP